MVGVVHGTAGRSVEIGKVGGRSNARWGAYFERVVAKACEEWLAQRPDVVHLFHDLANLRNVRGAGLAPISLGDSNIDHVVLSGADWLMLEAKGCAKGELRVEGGQGCLVQTDGRVLPQPWLDDQKARSRYGALVRLTDRKCGKIIYVLPDGVSFDHHSVKMARAFSVREVKAIVTVSAVEQGALDEFFPVNQPPADPADIARLVERLSHQGESTRQNIEL